MRGWRFVVYKYLNIVDYWRNSLVFVWKGDFYISEFVVVKNDLVWRFVRNQIKVWFTSPQLLYCFIDHVWYWPSSTHRRCPYLCTHYDRSLSSTTYQNAQITFGHLCEQPTSACSTLRRLRDSHLPNCCLGQYSVRLKSTWKYSIRSSVQTGWQSGSCPFT